MNNIIETKEHILYWINETIKSLYKNTIELTDNAVYSGNEVDDNLINEMLEQTVKLQAYLDKLRDGNYE